MAAPNLLESIMTAQDGGAMDNLGSRFGLDRAQTEAAMRELLPALSSGLKRQAGTGAGLRDLAAAVDRDGHHRYLEDMDLLRSDRATREGNGVLGHLLGSKEASRAVAAQASERTGLSSDLLKQMLPVLASLVMGAISKNMGGDRTGSGGGLLGQILTGALGGGSSGGGGSGGGLLGGVLGGLLGGGGQDRAAPGAGTGVPGAGVPGAGGGFGGLGDLGDLARMFEADDRGANADDLLESFFNARR